MSAENMVSLYDFLGKPAGKDLGSDVYSKAKSENIKTGTREVTTKNYNGKVMLYPVSFLKKYFFSNDAQ